MKTPDPNCGKTVFFDFCNNIHIARNNQMENQGNTMKITVYLIFLMSFHSSSPKQIAELETPDPNCGKTVFLTFIISSMLSEIIQKILINVWKIKESP